MRHRKTEDKKKSNDDSRKKNNKNKSKEKKPVESKSRIRTRSIVAFIIFVVIILVYLVLPLTLLVIPGLATRLIFLSFMRYPRNVDYFPEHFNLSATRNLYLTAEDGVRVGVWQVLPESMSHLLSDGDEGKNSAIFEAALGANKPVVLYFHGNSGSRASYHRILLYKLLSSLDANVIAIDYRGFADSGGTATPDKIQHDMETVYTWAKERSGDSKIYVWGHSLGTGISSHYTAELCTTGKCPSGLILESPFNNLLDAVEYHPFGSPWWILPGYHSIIKVAFEEGAEYFQSDENIRKITCPIMILHAKDDTIVPHVLGERLYHAGLEKRPKDAGPVTFLSFEAEEGLGHKYIVNAKGLSDILRKFIRT